jgi:phosphatidylglycerophosphate synthase
MYKHRFRLAAILSLVAYYCDCLDGYVARKYKMASKLGSMYDHVSDHVFIILLIISIWRINPKMFVWFLVIFIPSYLLCLYFISLQESYYDNNTHTGLDMVILHSIIPKTNKNDAERKLRYTRYFGPATLIIIFAVSIAMLDKY